MTEEQKQRFAALVGKVKKLKEDKVKVEKELKELKVKQPKDK